MGSDSVADNRRSRQIRVEPGPWTSDRWDGCRIPGGKQFEDCML